MLHKIDWLSFTVDVGEGEGRRSDTMPGVIFQAVAALNPFIVSVILPDETPEPGAGRKPYSMSWRFVEHHISVFAHPKLSHALIEVSGQGVERLFSEGRLEDVLKAVLNRITRLDIATDMLTDAKPTDFVRYRDGARFKTSGHITSPSGETCYIGSRQSDRFARVYRYNPPHERAHLLRAETQLMKMQARLAAQAILDSSVEAVGAAVGDVFGWKHPDWNTGEDEALVLKSWRPERHQGKTEFWLESQVRPALVKAYAGRPGDFWAWAERIVSDIVAPPTTE